MSTQPTTQTLVRNLEKLSRPIIFDNVGGACTATDIDFVFELYSKFLILGEVKENHKQITVGQELVTTRIVNSWNKIPGNVGIVIFAHHSADDKQILLADCIINKIYINGKWKTMGTRITVKDFVQLFATKYDLKHLKQRELQN